VNTQIMSQATQAASPANTILNQMQGQSITQGWDVVCAMNADRINELFAQQYALKVFQNNNLPPSSGTVTLQAGTLAVQFINVVLGPPLISFTPNSNDANLQIKFVSGTVNTVGANNVITASQSISPGDGYQLTGVVPLTSVEGEVENGHDVVLDITNAAAFTAHLGFASGAATILGQYFLTFLQNNASSFKYILGTLVYNPTGTNLTPVMFDLATQIDRTNPNDKGRLLLFIATTYNPKGGAQTSVSIADIIPDGYSATMLVSSQAVFQGILKSFYETTFSKFNVAAAASPNDKGVYSLAVTGGQIDVGVIQEKQNAPGGVADYWSGSSGWPGNDSYTDVVIPLAGIRIAIQDLTHMSLSANLGWNQSWGVSYPVPRTEGYHDTGTLGMNAGISSSMTFSVNAAQQTVNFAGTPAINVPNPDGGSVFDYWTMGYQLAQDITNATNAALTTFFQGGLPAINTFAVSNLLFPGQHILNFQEVYLPGDLVIFGDIFTSSVAASPASATVAAGQTQQFTATSNGQPASVTWSLDPRRGQISATGVYTAPSSVSRPQNILVTATTSDGTQSCHAVVTVVPAGVLLAPNAVIVQANAAVQFVASVAGEGSQAVTWSSSPAAVGTIAASGAYTPPTSVQSPTPVTITATSQANPQVKGSALAVVLAGLDTEGMTVTPTSASLQSSQTQQFKAENAAGKPLTPTWSVVSAANGNAGSIDAKGNYTAPATLTGAQVVVVVATLQDDVTNDTLAATALVYLEPSVDD
jgi:hypothetical protein